MKTVEKKNAIKKTIMSQDIITRQKKRWIDIYAVLLCIHGADMDECTSNIQKYTMITQDNKLKAELSLSGSWEDELKIGVTAES